MFKMITNYIKSKKHDGMIYIGTWLVFIFIVLWGIVGVIKEIEIDKSYYIKEGTVSRLSSNFFVLKSATMKYYNNNHLYESSFDYFMLDLKLKVNKKINIRVSSKKYWKISPDIGINYRLIPQLFKIFLGLIFVFVTIPRFHKKIQNYYLDN